MNTPQNVVPCRGSKGTPPLPLLRVEVETPEHALVVCQAITPLAHRRLQFVLLARELDSGYPLVYEEREALGWLRKMVGDAGLAIGLVSFVYDVYEIYRARPLLWPA